MAVQWNVTGIQKYSNSTSLLVGPVSSTDNRATVQCEADGQKSDTAHVLVGKVFVCVCMYIYVCECLSVRTYCSVHTRTYVH